MRVPHPPGIMEGLEGSGLTWQCCRFCVWRILVHRHWAVAAASGEGLPRRNELAGHRNGELRSAVGALGWQTPPEPRPPRASPPSSLASRACRVAAATDPASYWGRCCRRPGVRLRCSRTPASWDGDPHPELLHLLVPEMGNGARVEGAKGGPGEEGLRGRGGSRLSARGGAFSPGQSALGRRR